MYSPGPTVKLCPSRLHVVSALWLLACCTEGGRVDEAQYTCLDLSEGVGSEGVSGEGKREGGKRKRRLEEGEGRGDGGKRPRVEAGEEDEDDNDETRLDEEALLLQYQNGETDSEQSIGISTS